MDAAGIVPETDMPETSDAPRKEAPAPLSEEGTERLDVFKDFIDKLDIDKLDDKDKPEPPPN
jgi:hypothetical protein